MNAMWAVFSMEWRRGWLVVPTAAAATMVVVSLGIDTRTAVVPVGLGITLLVASRVGAHVVDENSRFLLARPVPPWAVTVGASAAAFTLVPAAWLSAISVLAITHTLPLSTWVFTQIGIMFLWAAVGMLCGGAVAGLRAGSKSVVLGGAAILASAVAFAWYMPSGELWSLLPTRGFGDGGMVFWSVTIGVVVTALASVARGVSVGRGRPEETMAATWRWLVVSVVTTFALVAAWGGYLRTIPINAIEQVMLARPLGLSGWVLMSGMIDRTTTYTPTFLTRPETGVAVRVRDLAPGMPIAVNEGGQVVAALGTTRNSRTARLLVGDIGETVTWRPPQVVTLDNWQARLALSPSGRLVAVWTPTSLTVYELSTGRPLSRVTERHKLRGALGFRGETHVVTEREIASGATGRDVEVVTLDVQTGTSAVVSRYQAVGYEYSSIDQQGRYLVVDAGTRARPEFRRIDLDDPTAPPRTWVVDRPNAMLAPPLVLSDGRVVLLVRGQDRASAELRVLDESTHAIALGRFPSAGAQWLGTNRIALGSRGEPDDPMDDVTEIVDLASGRIVHTVDRILPAIFFRFEGPMSSSPSVAFVENGRRVVVRPDLAH